MHIEYRNNIDFLLWVLVTFYYSSIILLWSVQLSIIVIALIYNYDFLLFSYTFVISFPVKAVHTKYTDIFYLQKDPHHALKEVTKMCILADCSLILAFR